MFKLDVAKYIEDFMKSDLGDRIISDVIGTQINVKLEREGDIVHFTLLYGEHVIDKQDVDIS